MTAEQKTKEQIHDEQIAPLIEQIEQICDEHKIGHLTVFALDDEMVCMSAAIGGEYEVPYPMKLAGLALQGKLDVLTSLLLLKSLTK